MTQVDNSTAQISFAASNAGMPAVAPVTVALPEGPAGEDYVLTDADKDEIAATVKAEVPLVKTAEQPTFVNSIEECTDTTKLYVLPDGYIYAYMYKTGYSNTDIMPVGSGQTKNGLTTTVNVDGSYTLDGTATATAVHKIYESNTALPAGFAVGGKYKMALEAGYVGSVAIMINYGSGFEDFISFNSAENSNKFVEFTIPDSAVGMQIKYYPAVNYQYANEVVKFSCYGWQEGGGGFNNTGLPFVPADYEGRIQALEKAVESLDGSADVSPEPMLAIIDDDGYKKFTTLLLPIVQEKGVPIASAVVVGNANGENSEDVTSVVMGWTEVETAYLAGAEILSHTYCHLSQAIAETMTKTQIQQDYQRAQYGMRKHGINADGLVFAGNSVSMDICQEACKLVYTYGFKSYGDVINFKGSIDPYKINRYKIEPDGSLNETDLKALIDTLVSGGTGWMVWMIHTSDGGFQQAQADIISTVIDYAIEQGVEIVTTECGVRHYL